MRQKKIKNKKSNLRKGKKKRKKGGAPVVASLGFHSDKRCVKWAMLQWRASQQRWERGEGVIEPKKKASAPTVRDTPNFHSRSSRLDARYQVCCSHQRHPVQTHHRLAAAQIERKKKIKNKKEAPYVSRQVWEKIKSC